MQDTCSSPTRPCKEGHVGEIWVRGPATGRCFVGPSENETDFSVPAAEDDTVREPFVRTGVVGAILDNKLYVVGSLSERFTHLTLLSSDGQKLVPDFHYWQDINRSIADIPDVAHCCTTSIKLGPQEFLISFAESGKGDLELKSLASRIIARIQEVCHVELYAVSVCGVGRLPRLKNGLIDGALCQSMFVKGILPCTHVAMDPYRALKYAIGTCPREAEFTRPLSVVAMNPPPAVLSVAEGASAAASVFDEDTRKDLCPFKSYCELLDWRVSGIGARTACIVLDSKGKESKTVTFEKLQKSAVKLAMYMKTKKSLQPGAVVGLVYNAGWDLLCAINACLYSGLVLVLLRPPSTSDPETTTKEMLRIVEATKITAFLTSASLEKSVFGNKAVQTIIKASGKAIPIISTDKSKGSFDLSVGFKPLREHSSPALIQCRFNGCGLIEQVMVTQETLLKRAIRQKEMYQLVPSQSLLSPTSVYSSLGFLYASVMGTLVGSSTVVIGDSDAGLSASSWLEALSKYKVQMCVVSHDFIETKMSDLAITKTSNLSSLRSFVIENEGRLHPELRSRVVGTLSTAGLRASAISFVHGGLVHPAISMWTTSDYEPLTLTIDLVGLRSGTLSFLEARHTRSLGLQDSGMVRLIGESLM